MKLESLVGRAGGLGRKRARQAILDGRVGLNGDICREWSRDVDRFQSVTLDGVSLRGEERAVYLMLHKPAGYLCATRDAVHPTVMEMIGHPERDTLHLVGRLDRASTGMVLLTNNGNWSKRVMAAEHKVEKAYRVETMEPIAADAVAAFARGFYFPTEGITTLPAVLEIVGEREAIVTLREGRYHQIKRMFHRTGNRVVSLHRFRIGGVIMEPELTAGSWRDLTPGEVAAIVASPESDAGLPAPVTRQS